MIGKAGTLHGHVTFVRVQVYYPKWMFGEWEATSTGGTGGPLSPGDSVPPLAVHSLQVLNPTPNIVAQHHSLNVSGDCERCGLLRPGAVQRSHFLCNACVCAWP